MLISKIKIVPIVSALIFYNFSSLAQKYEFGLGIGGVSYTGDLQRGYRLTKQSPGIQGIYRINAAQDVSFKFALLFGQVKGSDSSPYYDALSQVREASFSRLFLEGSAVFEYHFIDYLHKNSTFRWSPYLFAGVGAINIYGTDDEQDNFSKIQPVIPFGLGVKHLVGKQFSAAIEFGARKTFFDHLDRVSGGDVFDKSGFQFGNPGDKDWYYFLGVSFSYVLYNIPCVYRYVPNKTLGKK